VNYLSHFYIDFSKDTHFYNAGLILPDLARGNVKSFKEDVFENSLLQYRQLYQGCMKHYQRDKQFHASEWFTTLNEKVIHEVNHGNFSNKFQRKWFLAHILTELMIDRLIVKEHPDVCDYFYESLKSVDQEILVSFLKGYNANNISLFMDRFNHFIKVAFVGYYPDTNKFVYSLIRIMMRAGLPEPIQEDQNKLAVLCEKIESELFSNHNSILNQLKNVFND